MNLFLKFIFPLFNFSLTISYTVVFFYHILFYLPTPLRYTLPIMKLHAHSLPLKKIMDSGLCWPSVSEYRVCPRIWKYDSCTQCHFTEENRFSHSQKLLLVNTSLTHLPSFNSYGIFVWITLLYLYCTCSHCLPVSLCKAPLLCLQNARERKSPILSNFLSSCLT